MKLLEDLAESFKTMLHDEDPLVRMIAARALGSLGSPTALDSLLLACANDPDRLVRMEAEQAIRKCRRV